MNSLLYEESDMMASGLSTSEMLRERFGLDDSASMTSAVTSQLKELYKHNVLGYEKRYNYEVYKGKPFEDGEFDAKPIVLVLGQSQTGKTTFIRHFLGKDFPGMQNPSDSFSVLTHDFIEERVPGHVVQSDPQYPFQQLGAFGNSFLKKFELCKTNSDVLKDLWFIDTPGILSGAKQRGRGYKYADVVRWFAMKAQRIILIFDHNKLEINTEFESILSFLRTKELRSKIRVVLNKASQLDEPQLVLTYGSLMWTLCSAFRTAEEMKVFISSFTGEGDQPMPESHKCSTIFAKDAKDLLEELIRLPQEDAIRKANDVRERAIDLKLHIAILGALKKRIRSLFGKRRKKMDLVDALPEHLQSVAKELNISLEKVKYMGVQTSKDRLMTDHFNYKSDPKKTLDKLDNLIKVGVPRLLRELNGGGGLDLERDLVKMGLRKRRGIFNTMRAGDTSSRVQSQRDFKAGSVHSTQSRKSIFSVASAASKILNPFKKGDSKAGSQYRGSTRSLYKGRGSRFFSYKNRRSRKPSGYGTQASLIEQDVHGEEVASLSSNDDLVDAPVEKVTAAEQKEMIAMIRERNRSKGKDQS